MANHGTGNLRERHEPDPPVTAEEANRRMKMRDRKPATTHRGPHPRIVIVDRLQDDLTERAIDMERRRKWDDYGY